MRDTLVIVLSAFILPGVLNAHLITSQATLPAARPTAYPGVGVGQDGLLGRLPGHQLFARGRANCDNDGHMYCPTGTCFTDSTGLIGCCTVSSCVPRTTCIEYTAGVTSVCDENTGGCLYCSDSASPSCLTYTNTEASQWIQYCNAYASTEIVGYPNSVTGSIYQRDNGGTSTITIDTTSLSEISTTTTYKTPPCREEIPGATCPTSMVPGSIESSASGSLSYGAMDLSSSESNSQLISASDTSTSANANSNPTSADGLGAAWSSPTGVSIAGAGGSSGKVSSGAVAGIALGAAAGVAIVALILWWFWRRRECGSPSIKSMVFTYSGGNTAKEKQLKNTTPALASSKSDSWSAGASAPVPSTWPQSPDYPFAPEHFAGCQPVGEISEPGYGIQPQQRYTVMNPDPLTPLTPSATTAPLRGLSNQASTASENSLPISSVGLPGTPESNHSTRSPVSPVGPQTPTSRQPQYASSIYDGGQEPPSSVPRTTNAAPPSLPQEYSIVSLGSSADLYRGLSMRGDGARRPYLSPEDAVNGGWRNDEQY